MKKQSNAKAASRALIILLIIAAIVLLLVFGCSHKDAAQNDEATTQTTEQAAETTTQAAETMTQATETEAQTTTQAPQAEYTFRYSDRLKEHYRKHGIEMGFSSPEEYLAAANAVIANPEALTKREKEDGDYLFYVEWTNEFVVLSTDGYIRTYFCPDSGKRYFDRQ